MPKRAKPGIVKVFKTAVFKVHNPSQHKRAMMDYALRQGEHAFWKAIDHVAPKVPALLPMKKKERRDQYRLIGKELAALLKPLPISRGCKEALAASVQGEVIGQLDSYLELVDGKHGPEWPERKTYDPEDFEIGLLLLQDAATKEDEDEARDLMNRGSYTPNPRSTGVMKNRVADGALFLKDDADRVWAWLNLVPQSSRFARPTKVSELVDTRTEEVVTFTSKTGALFALEMGEWHAQEFFAKGIVQSTRLKRRADEYFIHATFAFEAPKVAPQTYLGVDRGIDLLAAWAVIDDVGQVKDRGQYAGARLREVQVVEHRRQREVQKRGKYYTRRQRRAVAVEEVHRSANAIVRAAAKNKAQVVVEDLRTITMGPHQKRPKGARRGGWRHMLTRAQYQKLVHALTYKLALEGLPEPRAVSAAYTSQTCAKCGHVDKASRESQAVFVCTKCKHKDNADANAARIIAAKGLHYDQVVKGRPKGKKLKEDEKFSAWFGTMCSRGGLP